MGHFQYRSGQLWCERVRVADVVESVGTPAYVYSRATILERIAEFRRAFAEVEPLICFSVKANGNLAVLGIMAQGGCGFDVLSGGELFRALRAGANPASIVFAGVGKTDREIEYALDSGILMFNVESEPELANISEIALAKGLVAPVALRLNPGIDPHTHHHIATGKAGTKFGIPLEEAEKIARRLDSYKGVALRGFHVHIGSQICETEPYAQAVGMVKEHLHRLGKIGEVPYLDMGGGFGIAYREEDKPPRAEDFAATIIPGVRGLGARLILEPGRFIVGPAGLLATTVQYVKRSSGKTFVVCDAAMNDLIRPTLYGAYHRIKPITEGSGEKEKVDVVGPVCEVSDAFARDRLLPRVSRGDVLAILDAGAYGFEMASNYNGRPRCCEVLVEDESFRVVRGRETYEDLIRGEVS